MNLPRPTNPFTGQHHAAMPCDTRKLCHRSGFSIIYLIIQQYSCVSANRGTDTEGTVSITSTTDIKKTINPKSYSFSVGDKHVSLHIGMYKIQYAEK